MNPLSENMLLKEARRLSSSVTLRSHAPLLAMHASSIAPSTPRRNSPNWPVGATQLKGAGSSSGPVSGAFSATGGVSTTRGASSRTTYDLPSRSMAPNCRSSGSDTLLNGLAGGSASAGDSGAGAGAGAGT